MASRRELAGKKAALKNDLRQGCADGRFLPGELAPPVRELAQQYGISLQTVLDQLQELVGEGVLYTVPRQGTFIGKPQGQRGNFYLLLLPHLIGTDTILRQIQIGFDGHIAQLGGTTLVMTQEMAMQQIQSEAMPPLAGVFRYSALPLPGLLESLNQRANARNAPMAEVNGADRGEISPNADTVAFDNIAGGRQATQHLQSLGHRRIAYFGLHGTQNTDCQWSLEREKGWHGAMTQASLETRELVFRPLIDLHTETAGGEVERCRLLREQARRLMRIADITAVVAANDWAAYQLMETLRELQIPAEHWPALVGFDDTPMNDGYLLTSLRLPWEEIGRSAADLLWERRHGRLQGPPVRRNVPMRLVPRLTCRAHWLRAPRLSNPALQPVAAH